MSYENQPITKAEYTVCSFCAPHLRDWHTSWGGCSWCGCRHTAKEAKALGKKEQVLEMTTRELADYVKTLRSVEKP